MYEAPYRETVELDLTEDLNSPENKKIISHLIERDVIKSKQFNIL